jgi:hypothetical protein
MSPFGVPAENDSLSVLVTRCTPQCSDLRFSDIAFFSGRLTAPAVLEPSTPDHVVNTEAKLPLPPETRDLASTCTKPA